ncbi:HlyD family secretion protein [[Eubacterium] contortum]|uniref:HlyD family secretion protein n=1 Tax=Faecalicatena contorta TaxID=39482 RepID=A0A174IGE1_9FIRM|nr:MULTISPECIES: HlyD family efflux transporter periplasmic adaptor subunit [Clostridia]CUO84130.1 HlyD family secretion protein [[Eubacterium] contortum] [Faecalicatena contorta]
MASRKDNSISINKYKRKREMNIGIFIFAIVFIYLIVTIVMYAAAKKISVYEVREGSILTDNSYTGLILREETVVHAENSGYINYFQNENSKIKAGANVYAVTSQKLSYPEETSTETSLSTEEQNTLIVKTQSFNENFNPQKFSSVYSLKNEIDNTLQNASNQTKTAQMDAVLSHNGAGADVYQTPRDGIMVLDFDGCESLTADSFKKADFDRSSYKKVSLEDNMQVKKGEPAYKLVTSEKWSVIIELDKDMAGKLADTTYIKTRIDKDSESIWADFSILKKDGEYYGRLDYDNSMIRYAGDRFLNIELILEDESGLKIPKSSVVEKEFFVVPAEYITTGGNSSASGVMVQKRGGNAVFQAADIYKSTEDGSVYLSTCMLKKGTVLVKPESAETLVLSETQPQKGVFNINKGYAVFRQVTILAESDEYYIVKEGDSYGLYNYDHIVQDGDSVDEDEVVY